MPAYEGARSWGYLDSGAASALGDFLLQTLLSLSPLEAIFFFQILSRAHNLIPFTYIYTPIYVSNGNSVSRVN